MKPKPRSTPELQALIGLFYHEPHALGHFDEVADNALPTVARKLLAHDQHMTVTVESHHGCAVDVRVLESQVNPSHYARKILLSRQTDGKVVQFGIVRLAATFLGPEIRREIEEEQTPLGRILIKYDVLRIVRLLSLWKIDPSLELAQFLGLPALQTCYGRTALIYCNGVPAVELLEIVPPEG